MKYFLLLASALILTACDSLSVSEPPSTPVSVEKAFQEKLDQSYNTENDWVTHDLSKLQVSFSTPSSWEVITEENASDDHFIFSNPRYDGVLVVVHESPSFDPTQVRIYRKSMGISRYKSLHETPETEKSLATLSSGAEVEKRVYKSERNDCSTLEYVHELSDSEIGIVVVTGVCPSHDKGYDELKIKVAESVVFMSSFAEKESSVD